LIYIDTSALLRLVFPDETTPAVQRLLEPGTHLVSSVLLRIEARRATMRRAPRRMPRVDLLLDRVDTVAIDDAVVELAGRVPGSVLRSLDAIHLATTLLIRDEVESLVTYDARLADAARAHDLAVVMPA
jgi:predicted nucleic acid-binding protein